jgi:serralysin
VFDNALYFSANDLTHGTELWKVDTNNNVTLVDDINSGSGASSPGAAPGELTVFNGTLYFAANDATHGNEPYKVDANGNVSLVQDINPNSSSSNPTDFTPFTTASSLVEIGGAGNDHLVSGHGNDTMTGNASADIFVFNPSFGKDVITDYVPGTDALEFDHTIFADAAALLAATTDENGSAVVTHGTDTVTLNAITKAQLTAHQGDLHFV